MQEIAELEAANEMETANIVAEVEAVDTRKQVEKSKEDHEAIDLGTRRVILEQRQAIIERMEEASFNALVK